MREAVKRPLRMIRESVLSSLVLSLVVSCVLCFRELWAFIAWGSCKTELTALLPRADRSGLRRWVGIALVLNATDRSALPRADRSGLRGF
jgi:hypothetical protein